MLQFVVAGCCHFLAVGALAVGGGLSKKACFSAMNSVLVGTSASEFLLNHTCSLCDCVSSCFGCEPILHCRNSRTVPGLVSKYLTLMSALGRSTVVGPGG